MVQYIVLPKRSLGIARLPLACASAGAAVSYTLATSARASSSLCLCSIISGASLGWVLPRFAGEDEMLWVHWILFGLGTILAAMVLLGIAIHNFNPMMFALCPFCGQPVG